MPLNSNDLGKTGYDEILRKLVEKAKILAPTAPGEPTCVIGPIINSRQIDRISSLVDTARADGATIHCGGASDGSYYEATVISDVDKPMRNWREEIFGPVACVVSADNVDEAIELANDTDYGLSAAIVTKDAFAGEQIAERITPG